VLDVTFSMNVGWAKTRECGRLVIYRSAHQKLADPVYHPVLVGPEFFRRTGAVI
jgi:hypothetical protein